VLAAEAFGNHDGLLAERAEIAIGDFNQRKAVLTNQVPFPFAAHAELGKENVQNVSFPHITIYYSYGIIKKP
jgi:hypothetical protein